MSRLDPKKGKGQSPKRVVPLSPPAEQVQATMADKRQADVTTAASYNERVQTKRAQVDGMKNKGLPLGGAPPLDPAKMKKIAGSMGPRPSFEDEAPAATAQQPEEQEPRGPPPVPGVGSAYSVNQAMAQGQVSKPVSMREAKEMATEDRGTRKPLSQESIDALEAAQEAQIEEGEATDHPLEEGDEAELSAADAELERDVGNLFNYGAIQEQQRTLMNPERREKIEKGLVPLLIEDMIMKREIQQSVMIIPSKLSYLLRTFNQKEHLFCLQYVYDHPGSVVYNEEFLNTCKLVCALVSINGAHLPTHLDKDGEVDKDLFEKKMSHVAGFPTQLIADLSVQIIWFNERVTKLFSLDNLKNG